MFGMIRKVYKHTSNILYIAMLLPLITGGIFCGESPEQIQSKYICSPSSIAPLNDSLIKVTDIGIDFSTSFSKGRFLGDFEHHSGDYWGFLSYDISNGEITASTFCFTIDPRIHKQPAKFKKYWHQGLVIAGIWVYFFTNYTVTFDHIVPFYNEILTNAERNQRLHSNPAFKSSRTYGNRVLTLNCDLNGLLTWELSVE